MNATSRLNDERSGLARSISAKIVFLSAIVFLPACVQGIGAADVDANGNAKPEKNVETKPMTATAIVVSNEEKLHQSVKLYVQENLQWPDDTYEIRTQSVHKDGKVEIWAVHEQDKDATVAGAGESLRFFLDPDSFVVIETMEFE